MSTTLHRRRGRDLVPAELFDRLVQRVTVDGRIPPGIAERVTDQVLAFLSVSATTSRVFLRPSRTIDAGWHAIILDTQSYQDVCTALGSSFIHHVPDDRPITADEGVERTMAAMLSAGLNVDREWWTVTADCGEVGCGAGRPPPTT